MIDICPIVPDYLENDLYRLVIEAVTNACEKEADSVSGRIEMAKRLLLVETTDPRYMGGLLRHAALSLGIETVVHDVRLANQGPRWAVAAAWRMGRRFLRIGRYGRSLLERCEQFHPQLVLCGGIAPVSRNVLLAVQQMGIEVFNYLTDDPWNPGRYAAWFLKALRHYNHVFSPRRANLEDLKRHGCPAVSYLPFAYCDEMHLGSCWAAVDSSSQPDIVFVGGADSDRVPFITALIKEKFSIRLYGGYWERFRETRPYAYGFINPKDAQRATTNAKIALCLVRRANRDGHCMRSFEIPAMAGCMLAESTPEHHDFFGEEGLAVIYFRDIPELIQKVRWLLQRPDERQRLREAVHKLITSGGHTYRDRLLSMLQNSVLGSDCAIKSGINSGFQFDSSLPGSSGLCTPGSRAISPYDVSTASDIKLSL